MRYERPCHGFTLIELMVTCALIGILTTLAISYTAPMVQHQQFASFTRATIEALNQARFYALRMGSRAAVSIENRQVVAFVDLNGNYSYDAGEMVIFSYPKDLSTTINTNFTMVSWTMRERTTGPQTAFLDSRGFYIDAHDGFSRHDANICLTDTSSGETKNINLNIFGNAAVTSATCAPQPDCPNVDAP